MEKNGKNGKNEIMKKMENNEKKCESIYDSVK
jgi:hypothetical protein